MKLRPQSIDFYLPLICMVFLMILFHQTSLDEWLAAHFYSSKDLWIYRDNFFFEKVLHKGGVLFSGTVIVGLIVALISVCKNPAKRQIQNYLSFSLIATLLTIILVFLLKRITTFPCPWNSLPFAEGGALVPSLTQMFSSDFPNPRCFPSGHASAGYSFLSLYFGYTYVYGKRNFWALIPGISLGLIFGIAQQMRGAHYMSHDFATIIISIFSSWLTLLVYTYYDKEL